MVLTDRADVLVVGFGLAGAAAAIGAAEAGCDVLVLDKAPLGPALTGRCACHLEHREQAGPEHLGDAEDGVRDQFAWLSSRCGSQLPPGRNFGQCVRDLLRRAAVESRVRVRPQATVHELLVEGRQVVGAGYGAIGANTAEAAWHRQLYLMSLRARGSSAIAQEVFTEAAERLWEESFMLGTVECAAVVLATPLSDWEFVGSSLKAVLAAEERAASVVPRPVPSYVASLCPTSVPALRVDTATGAVVSGGGWPVPGLFTATAGLTEDRASDSDVVAAGRRAGRACLPKHVGERLTC